MEDLGAASSAIPGKLGLRRSSFHEARRRREQAKIGRVLDNDGMEGLMRISLAMAAVLFAVGAAQAQGTVKKQASWTRPAPVQQVQSISNGSLRYYGGPKGERGLAMPSGR